MGEKLHFKRFVHKCNKTIVDRKFQAINGSAKRKKIRYRKRKRKTVNYANSTMNVSAKFYNQNAKYYSTLWALLHYVDLTYACLTYLL